MYACINKITCGKCCKTYYWELNQQIKVQFERKQWSADLEQSRSKRRRCLTTCSCIFDELVPWQKTAQVSGAEAMWLNYQSCGDLMKKAFEDANMRAAFEEVQLRISTDLRNAEDLLEFDSVLHHYVVEHLEFTVEQAILDVHQKFEKGYEALQQECQDYLSERAKADNDEEDQANPLPPWMDSKIVNKFMHRHSDKKENAKQVAEAALRHVEKQAYRDTPDQLDPEKWTTDDFPGPRLEAKNPIQLKKITVVSRGQETDTNSTVGAVPTVTLIGAFK